VKAPVRSYRRGSLRASSLVARGRAARIRGAARLAPLTPAVLASPGRRRAAGPFHSHPRRL